MSIHVVVIGAYGSAGVAAAEGLASETVDGEPVQVTMIDHGDPGGGLCILRGCMPSKEVLSAGAHRFQARHDDRLHGTPEVDLERVVERKNDNVLGFAEHRRAAVHGLADEENVEFIHDTAEVLDAHTIRTGGRTIDADYLVVATGSSVNIPDLPGIDDVDVWTSADVLEATAFPDSGVVMGFGYIGLELAPYLAEAGSCSLTIVEHDERPLDEGDPEFGDAILDIYEEFDLEVVTNTYEQRIESTDEGVRVHLEDVDGTERAIEGEALFAFTGRQPDLPAGLDGIVDPRPGWVDATMRATDVPHVYVVGDANGREQVLHVAKKEGSTAAANILADARSAPIKEYHPVHHHVIFSGLGVYPYARVGHSRLAAEKAGIEFVHVTREAADDGVFKTKDVPEGRASLVVGTDGTVLGYQGLHYHADVMAKTMQLAVEMELDVREIPDRAYHPTTPEIIDGLIRDAVVAVEEA